MRKSLGALQARCGWLVWHWLTDTSLLGWIRLAWVGLYSALTATDPNVAVNHVVFHWREFVYKKVPPGPSDHVKIHFALDGCICHVDSDEAKHQKAEAQAKEDAREEWQRARIAKALEAGACRMVLPWVQSHM